VILLAIVLVPLVAGLAAWLAAAYSTRAARWIASLALLADLGMVLGLWGRRAPTGGHWLAEFDRPWLPSFGVHLHLAVDGLGLVMLLLTFVLGVVAVIGSWNEITERVGLFHANLLWVIAGVCGVFLAVDLIVFYVAWEAMLIPMVLLIAIWGAERRTAAAVKFLIFTQAGSLAMLLAILGLAFQHRAVSGQLSFALDDLLHTPMSPVMAGWLLAGFVIGFGVKLPALGLHSWLPDAHTQAPTAGSVLLAGLLLKTGAYGLVRFALPLFPEAARRAAPWLMALGAAGILYGALLAFAQTDIKRLVAYTSVSHMGFVLLGVFALDPIALQGVVVQMVAHGFATGALFLLAGTLSHRLHTREMGAMGGLWARVPRMGAAAMFFAMASLGLPGMASFVAELLVLLGAWQAWPPPAAVAALGLVAATVYSLWLIQRVFHGEPRGDAPIADLDTREVALVAVMGAVLVWLGLYPIPLLAGVAPVLHQVLSAVGG